MKMLIVFARAAHCLVSTKLGSHIIQVEHGDPQLCGSMEQFTPTLEGVLQLTNLELFGKAIPWQFSWMRMTS